MNILFLASSADWHVDLWTKYFTTKHDVYLFSDKEDYRQDQPFKNVTIIYSEGYLGRFLNKIIKSKSYYLFKLNQLISVRYFAKCVNETICKHNIDVVHAHGLYQGYLASFLKSNIPIVFTPMGSDVMIFAQQNKIYKYMAKRAFSRADVVTNDSLIQQNKGYLVGARKDKNYIIQNGVDSSIFFPKPNDVKKQYDIADEEILIFSPREIRPIYNIDIVVSSVANLKQAGYPVRCMLSRAIVNKYCKNLKAQIYDLGISENIIWHGWLTYEEMAKYTNAADIVVSIPSSDSSPKSVYEAMFCGKPIIVTDLPWSHELLSDCNCLSRVRIRDVIHLSESIAEIIDNKKYAELLSTNALDCAPRYFDYHRNMKKMEKIMMQFLD